MRITSPRAVLGLLLAVNLFNYIDRQVVYSLLPLIIPDLRLSDVQAGSLASAFMLIYMLAAPPIAWLADTRGRRPWIVGGVVLWSLATAASGFASGFASLFGLRALVGVGESCYGAISPSFVAERFSPQSRGRAMALFSMAIPVGSALGYAGGGFIGKIYGWRLALMAVGIPGLILAALCALLPNDPPHRNTPSALTGYREVWAIPSFRMITFAGAGMTFALGGFAVWIPTFFHRVWGLDVSKAGLLFGGLTVIGGLAGSLLGGWISDRLRQTRIDADLLVSGFGLLLGMPLAALAIHSRHLPTTLALLLLAETLLFLNTGPLNSAIVSVTRLQTRSMAFAANIFVIHLLGDAASPTLIGWGSDLFGLTRALVLSCLALGLGGCFCLLARSNFARDCEQASAA